MVRCSIRPAAATVHAVPRLPKSRWHPTESAAKIGTHMLCGTDSVIQTVTHNLQPLHMRNRPRVQPFQLRSCICRGCTQACCGMCHQGLTPVSSAWLSSSCCRTLALSREASASWLKACCRLTSWLFTCSCSSASSDLLACILLSRSARLARRAAISLSLCLHCKTVLWWV